MSPARAVDNTAGAATISITNPLSSFYNGTNSAIWLAAYATPPDANHARVNAVRYSISTNGGAPFVVGTSPSAPWMFSWAPGSIFNGYHSNTTALPVTIYADALDNTGAIINSATPLVTSGVDNLNTMSTTSPPVGSTVVQAADGTIHLSGTSNGVTSFAINYNFRDGTTGQNQYGSANATAIPVSGGTWSASIPLGTCATTGPAGCIFTWWTGANSPGYPGSYTSETASWKLVRYSQVVGSVTISPAAATVAPGITKQYVATVLDTQGASMSGVNVTLTKTATGANTAVLSPTSGTSAIDGTVGFTASDSASEVTTLRATATGVAAAATATFTTANPTAGGFTALPAKALFATPYTGGAAGTGSSNPVGTEYPFSSPAVRMCFTYAGGGPVDASSAAITANVNVSLIRTVKTGSTSTPGAPSSPALTQDQVANPGCYLVAHTAAGSEEEGTDAFTGYYNADGVAGYQGGGTDVLATPVSTAWGQDKLTGSTGTAQISTYGTAVFSSKTLDGQPFPGRKLNLAVTSPASSTLNPTQPTGTTYLNATTASCVSDASGNCAISVTDPNVVTTVLTASDNITDGSVNQVATGAWGTAQVAFNLSPPTTGVFTSTPTKTLYGVPFTGTLAGTGTGSTAPVGSEYTTGSQSARICFAYAGGSPIDSSNAVAAGRVFVSVTRTVKTGSTSTPGSAAPVSLTQDQSAHPGCFLAPHPAQGTEEEGSDAYTGYYNADGVAGYQAGGGDILVSPLTVSWGQLKTTGSTTTGLKGRYATATFTSKTPDGQPFAGRKLTLTITSPASSTLNATQPAGTTYLTATMASCLTDSNGGCAVSVTDANSVSTVITASDNVTDATLGQVATGGWGTASLTFNSIPGGLDSVGVSPVSVLQPAVNTGPNRQRPGDIAHYSFTLLDTNGGPLASKSVALTVSQGYFTPDCTNYASCTFTPAPADGNTVGAATSLGQSMNVTSDASGMFTFATSIARDSGLDATGRLAVNLTVIGANGAATAALTTFSTLGTALVNASTLSIVPLTSSDALSGSVADNGTNKVPGQAGLLAKPGSDFQLRLTDGFGNLATLSNCAVNLALTPSGAQTSGSGPYLGSPGNTTANGCGSFTTTTAVNGVPPESFHVDSDNPSTTANGTTLTASWPIPFTRFTAVTGPPTSYTTTAGPASSLAVSKQLSLYALDQRTLTTAMSQTPNSTVQISTAVTVAARVTDSVGNPLVGAAVTWQRSGPNDASGAPQTVGGTSTTSATGTATFTFTSPTVGAATITAITKNTAGTELTRGTASTTFITGPTPTPTPTATPTASPTSSPTVSATGTASPTPTGTPGPTPTATASPTGTASPTPTATPTPSPTGSPTATPSPVPTSPAGSVVTIAGGDWQTPVFGVIFTITGTAPAGSLVTLSFHKSGSPAGTYGLIRTLTTPASGVWTRAITATFDYRFYATITTVSGPVSSGNVLFQPSPIIGGPTIITTARNQPYLITGQAAPYSVVQVHFHRNGTAASDYSTVRPVTTTSTGHWQRLILANTDYRFYASRNPADTPTGRTTYLLQTR